MQVRELSAERIEQLAGTRHGTTGMQYPINGMQPYYQWLMRTLELLAESSCGALRVHRKAGSDTQVVIGQGRASIDEVAVAYEGGEVELEAYNNATALLWLYEDGGQATVGVDDEQTGWPSGKHVKLARVSLAEGAIVEVEDRRFETVFRV